MQSICRLSLKVLGYPTCYTRYPVVKPVQFVLHYHTREVRYHNKETPRIHIQRDSQATVATFAFLNRSSKSGQESEAKLKCAPLAEEGIKTRFTTTKAPKTYARHPPLIYL